MSKTTYSYPKADHWHVGNDGAVYDGQRKALANCPDGARVQPCWNTAHRTMQCECEPYVQTGACIHTVG